MANKKVNKGSELAIGYYRVGGQSHDVIGSYEVENGRTLITLIDVDGPLHNNNYKDGRRHQTFIQVFNLRRQDLKFVGKYSQGSDGSCQTTGRVRYQNGKKLIYLLMEGRHYELVVIPEERTNEYSKEIVEFFMKLMPTLLALKDFDVVPRKIMDAFKEMARNSESSLKKLGVIDT